MHADRRPVDGNWHRNGKELLEILCEQDGSSFGALREELGWSEQEVQDCLRYLNARGYVSARVLPSLKMRYAVTELGWSVSELVADLEKQEPGA